MYSIHIRVPLGFKEVCGMIPQCKAINLKGLQCAKKGFINGLCVVHYEKMIRFKVDVVE
tara:strand:- start:10412 stop:10588 length:177 start_codon:yes stop_codon:yes gene_type:complete